MFEIEAIDIEAAFLEGDITIPTFIEFPEGLEELGFIFPGEGEKYCIQLLKSMYGNVDAALKFFKTYVKHLTAENGCGLTQSKADPCVFFKRDKNGKTVLLAVAWVDDTVFVGTREEIDRVKTEINKRFNYTEQKGFVKHLGVWYKEKRDEDGERYLEANMSDTVENIIKTYEKDGATAKLYKTPGTPGISTEKHEGEPHEATLYRKIVGKIMYLVCKLMPEGSNAARELSRQFGNPNEEHWKEVERFIGYLKEKKEELKLVYRKP